MNLQHKHWAIIAIGVLTAIFVVLVIWYSMSSNQALAPADLTATSTLPVATTPRASTPPAHITEHAAYYDIDLTYPSATPLSGEANTQAVARMKASMQSIASQFKVNGNFANLTKEDIKMMNLGERKMALGSEYTTYKGAYTVSYVFLVYEDTLGAHPNANHVTFTFDTRTGEELSLGDLFSAPNYLSLLSARARSDLPGIIEKMSGFEGDPQYIKSGTEPTTENFSNFAIDGKTLRLIFTPYQVGPWALGTVVDPIPLSHLSDLLKTQYKP